MSFLSALLEVGAGVGAFAFSTGFLVEDIVFDWLVVYPVAVAPRREYNSDDVLPPAAASERREEQHQASGERAGIFASDDADPF
jgi:hypothetical protein